jgi:hypothetical protein
MRLMNLGQGLPNQTLNLTASSSSVSMEAISAAGELFVIRSLRLDFKWRLASASIELHFARHEQEMMILTYLAFLLWHQFVEGLFLEQ